MHFLQKSRHDVSNTPKLVLNYRLFYDILIKSSTIVGSFWEYSAAIMQQIAEKRSVIAIKRFTMNKSSLKPQAVLIVERKNKKL